LEVEVSRLIIAGLFIFVAFAAALQAVSSFEALFADPTLRSWAVAGYSVLKAGVAAAFSFFVLVRAPSRRPSRDPVAFAACATAIGAVIALQGPSDSAATSLVLVGEIVALVSCAWLLVSALALGRCFGVLPEVRGLVTRGPYRLVRHPVYLGEFGALAGLVLAAPSRWNLGVAVAFAAAQATRIRLEERALLAELPEYADYAARTPRLIPRLPGIPIGRRLQRATLVVAWLAAAGLVASPDAGAALRAPTPVSPAAGAQVSLVPAFAWNPVAGADRYEFQIAADAGFNAPVLGAGDDRFFTRNGRATLKKTVPNGTYWWRVRAANAKGVVSKWSQIRSFRKAWTATAALQSPADGAVVAYPLVPLKLSWSQVPGAAKYEVALATDPLLGSLVGGKAVETQASSFTRAGALASGTYYWRITPMDAQGNKGSPSQVWSFVWFWPSTTSARFADLAPEAEVVDPQFSWDAVPGAARYEVEISSSRDFAPGSRVCCSTEILGTSHSPPRVFRDNTYYWRVRAFDPDDNAGIWNEGPQCVKAFDKAPAGGLSIQNLRLRDNVSDPAVDVDPATPQRETYVPQLTWDPVPGASSYQVEVTPMGSTDCNWTASPQSHWTVTTSVNAWTPLGSGWGGRRPYPDLFLMANDAPALARYTTYCARVRARSDRDINASDVYGDYTYMVNGVTSATPGPSFTWMGYPNGGPCSPPCNAGYLGGGDYVLPASGTLSTRTPYFTWKPLRRPRIRVHSTAGAHALDIFLQRCTTVEFAIRNYIADPTKDELLLYERSGSIRLLREAFVYPDADVADLAKHVNGITPHRGQGSGFISAQALASGPLNHGDYVGFESGTMSYFVLVAKDPQFSNIADYAFTQVPAYAPRGARPTSYSDETTSYYWVMLPANTCNGGEAVGTPFLGAPRSFEKRSTPPTILAPASGSAILGQPTFRWTLAEGARRYRLQIAQDPTFGEPIEDVLTNATSYTTSTTYPADTVLYWRVRADDENLIGLTWSSTGTFQKRLPVPIPSPYNPTRGDFVPTWTWDTIIGAVSYDVAADLPDGTHRLLTGFRTAAVTPVLMYGTGLFTWRVRANFPKAPFGSVPGPFSATIAFTRTIGEPTGARADVSSRHILLSWEPKAGVKAYRVQISTRSDFATNVENVTTDNTSYAPLMTHLVYVARVPLFWRVAAIDEGNNVGDYTPAQRIGDAKRMRLAARGRAIRGRSTAVSITVRALPGGPLKGVTVRVSGAGVRPRAVRTNRLGRVRFKIRPTRRGKISFRATKTGYMPAMLTQRVR
jgi:protein-S-isoprenylcysteine O-methyltransferase Ste14